jgi:hypothetical protein
MASILRAKYCGECSSKNLSVSSFCFSAYCFLFSAIYNDPAGTVLCAKKSSTALEVLLTLIPPAAVLVFGFGPITLISCFYNLLIIYLIIKLKYGQKRWKE